MIHRFLTTHWSTSPGSSAGEHVRIEYEDNITVSSRPVVSIQIGGDKTYYLDEEQVHELLGYLQEISK